MDLQKIKDQTILNVLFEKYLSKHKDNKIVKRMSEPTNMNERLREQKNITQKDNINQV